MDVNLNIPRADRSNAPLPRKCSCGAEWRSNWYVDERLDGGGHWAYPHLDPCVQCEPTPSQQLERDLRRRMVVSGVSDDLVHYRFDRVTMQRAAESYETFQRRTLQDKQLGVSVVNIPAMRQIADWHPPKWLMLHGPPGTGKTTVMACIARRLLTVNPEKWVDIDISAATPEQAQRLREMGRHQAFVRTVPPRVEYARLDELLDRERVKLRGLDDHPVVDVAKAAGILLLDELGLEEKPSGLERTAVERIIGHRYDRGLCTVVATNRTPDELCGKTRPLYGHRVADRLRAATHVALGGESWRGVG